MNSCATLAGNGSARARRPPDRRVELRPQTPTSREKPPPFPSPRANAASTPAAAALSPPLKPPKILRTPTAAELRSLLRSLLGAGAGGEGRAAVFEADGVSSSPSSSSSPPAAAPPLVPVEYEFSRTQERAFLELDSAMTRCAKRYLFLAVASAAAAAFLGGGSNHHHAAPAVAVDPHEWIAKAEAAQAFAVSIFLWAAGEPFSLIAETRGSDLKHLLRGLTEVAHALLEATIMSCGLCLLFAASAAALQPRLAFPAIAAMSAAATIGRATLHRHPRALPPLLEAPEKVVRALTSPLRFFDRRRKAERLREMLRREKEQSKAEEKEAGGARGVGRSSGKPPVAKRKLTGSPSFSPSDPAAAADGDDTTPAAEHEFTTEQEKVFRLLVRSLHVLCYARLAHAACEALVAAASLASGDAVGSLAAAVGSLEVAATAQLFWSASHAFDGVISSSGNDIKLLLRGVASAPGSRGLAAMFEKLSHVLELALLLKVAPLSLAGAATLARSSGLLSRNVVGALREFAAGVGVA